MQRQDVRKKKHPELQPYVPSDRFTVIRPNNIVHTLPKKEPFSRNKKATSGVDMTRLTQLSKPKNTNSAMKKPSTTTSSSVTSSTTTTTTTRSATASRTATRDTSSNSSSTTTTTTRFNTIQPRRPSSVKSSSRESSCKQASEEHDVSSLPSQELSELSINDRHYESAASEITQQQIGLQIKQEQESVVSTNGNTTTTSTDHNKTRNLDSLCADLEANLIAEGLVRASDIDGRKSNGTHLIRGDDIRKTHTIKLEEDDEEKTPTAVVIENATPSRSNANDSRAPALLLTSTPSSISQTNNINDSTMTDDDVYTANNTAVSAALSNGSLRLQATDDEEDLRRKKAEEELREQARREEEERKNRHMIVESILSKFNQSS